MQSFLRQGAVRLATRTAAAPVRTQTRRMGGGGHGHAKPEYTGFEKTVRTYLPENYHISYFVLGTYAVLIAVSQIRSGSKKTAAIAATPEPETPDYHTVIAKSSDIPSFGTPEWEAFIQSNSDNFQVWLESNFKEGAAATH